MGITEQVILWCLAILAAIDLKNRRIPVVPVLLLGVLGVCVRLFTGGTIWEAVLGMIPGLLLLGLAVCTRESIGIGDGLVLLLLGAVIGAVRAVAVLGMSLLLAAVLSLWLLLWKKAKRKTELPFLPCLCGGYLLCVLW